MDVEVETSASVEVLERLALAVAEETLLQHTIGAVVKLASIEAV